MRILRLMLILTLAVSVMWAIPTASAQDDCGRTYTVQPGDTLTRIANVCGTTVEALREANPDVFSLIYPGDVLNLPLNPVVTLNLNSGAIGTPITVTAADFPANAPVRVGIGQAGQTALVAANATTTPNGALSLQIVVPGSAPVGSELFVTVQTLDGALTATSGAFTVNNNAFGVGGPAQSLFPAVPAPIDVTVGGVVFNRVNVFMIAPGSDSVFTTSCGESVVAVQVAVTPTVAPLTAGVESLLAFSAAQYGLPNLVNPLAGTGLVLDEVLIQNGEAVINFNGALASTGDGCQDARIRSQIELTALQYTTVDTVSIFVNGVPIESILP